MTEEANVVALYPDHDAAEQALLGALLIDRDAWKAISETIREADFARPDHRLVFAAIAELGSQLAEAPPVLPDVEQERALRRRRA